MGGQILHSAEHIDVHKQEIAGDIKQTALTTLTQQQPAAQGSQIEQRLEQQEDIVEKACT